MEENMRIEYEPPVVVDLGSLTEITGAAPGVKVKDGGTVADMKSL